jgi:hypothetical protein
MYIVGVSVWEYHEYRSYLSTVRAPWYAYVCVIVLSTKYSWFAVWREKNAKSTHINSS